MSKVFQLVRYPIRGPEDAVKFEKGLASASKDGYNIDACGMGANDCGQAWAIMSKPVDDPPKQISLLDAARIIAEECKKHTDGCLGCPLDRHNRCLASCGRGSGLPIGWAITKEV